MSFAGNTILQNCPICQYSLCGLHDFRCPECGLDYGANAVAFCEPAMRWLVLFLASLPLPLVGMFLSMNRTLNSGKYLVMVPLIVFSVAFFFRWRRARSRVLLLSNFQARLFKYGKLIAQVPLGAKTNIYTNWLTGTVRFEEKETGHAISFNVQTQRRVRAIVDCAANLTQLS